MNFINNQWCEAQGPAFTSFNPATQKIIWEGRESNQTDIDLAVEAARAGFNIWGQTPLDTRVMFLVSLQKEIQQATDEIAACISEETGKALWECQGEVQSMIKKIDLSIEAYYLRTGDHTKPLDSYQLHIRHRPLGVMAVFVPFNFPGHLLHTHVVPAILAGNTVVIKPSEQTPKTAELILTLWEKIGLPAGVINLIHGAGDTGRALAAHPDLNAICFTGSFRVGQLIHKQLAGQTDKLLALEMGGNNPIIVGNINDIDNAVRVIIQSGFITSGQRCTCARRLIIVENGSTSNLLEKLVAKTKMLPVAYPHTNKQTFMGTLINAQAGAHVLEKQKELQQQGGKSLLEVQALDPNNLALLSPGIIDVTEVKHHFDEEVFGPLLQVFRVENLEEAIAKANHTQYGLTAGILSVDKNEYQQFFNHSRAGTVNWNRPTTGLSGIAPFGGLGHSGNFRPSGYYAADYCAYPVVSLESEHLKSTQLPPGL